MTTDMNDPMPHLSLPDEPRARHYWVPADVIAAGQAALEEHLAGRRVAVYDRLGSETLHDLARGYPNPSRARGSRVKVTTLRWEE